MRTRPRHFLLLEVLLAGLLAAGTIGLMLGNLRVSRSVHERGVQQHRAAQVLEVAALQVSSGTAPASIASVDNAFVIEAVPTGARDGVGCQQVRLSVVATAEASPSLSARVWWCP
jgi:hypothetical protein